MQDLNSVLIQGVVAAFKLPGTYRKETDAVRFKLDVRMATYVERVPIVVPNPTLASYTVKEISVGMCLRVVGHLQFDPMAPGTWAVFAEHIECAPKVAVSPMVAHV